MQSRLELRPEEGLGSFAPCPGGPLGAGAELGGEQYNKVAALAGLRGGQVRLFVWRARHAHF